MLSNNEITSHTKEVAIIVAVRNEQNYIRKCLDSLLNQDFPPDRFQIIVIDGLSEDNTKSVVEEYQKRFPERITLYDNPNRVQAVGRNIGIKNSSSEFVLYIDGHSQPSSSYVRKLVTILRTSPRIAGIGGIHQSPNDETFFGKAINIAQGSLLGGGRSSYRPKTKPNFVDPLSFCMYRRSVLEKTGLFNESLVSGEDYELNWRIRHLGYNLMTTPDAVVYYYRRYNTLKRFIVRMSQYGFWKGKISRIHPASIKPLFFLPIFLIVLCVLILPLSIIRPDLAYLDLIFITGYLIAVLATSVLATVKEHDFRYIIIFVIIIVEHFAIGVGSIAGFMKKS
jgi:cellulose synthase/poly-beta-1,6-N-acetylglucosamine synthase-like glycosyltransferase